MDKLINQKDAIMVVNCVDRPSGLFMSKRKIEDMLADIRMGIRTLPAEPSGPRVKPGYWVVVGKTEKGSKIIRCSNCHKERKRATMSTYCRDCGSHMCMPTMKLVDGELVYTEE